MRAPGFFDRRVRGFRIVELGAMAVLVALVLVVYLAKDGAGDKRADIDRVQQDIVAEQDQIRLLKAEVAHQEQPERLQALASQYLDLQPVAAKHEVDAAALADVARVAAPAPVAPGVGSGLTASSNNSVSPGLVPGAQEHERNAVSAPATASPPVFPGPRIVTQRSPKAIASGWSGGDAGGGGAKRAGLIQRHATTPPTAAQPAVVSAH